MNILLHELIEGRHFKRHRRDKSGHGVRVVELPLPECRARGGVDGEGSHHLVRPGGESQNVYLTSSIIDLDQFVGRSVKIWGATFEAQQAGWLMDVGRLQVLE